MVAKSTVTAVTYNLRGVYPPPPPRKERKCEEKMRKDKRYRGTEAKRVK